MTYKAKQGDVVWLDFDPSEGDEIVKRCPAVVLSSNAYNRATGFVIVAPITRTSWTLPGYVDIVSNKSCGEVETLQVQLLDETEQGNRKIDFIERMNIEDFYTVAEATKMNFDFKFSLLLQ